MKLVKGNLWDSRDDLILVTCNSYIKKDGALVMGRGAALEMKTKFPKIDYRFGKMINYYSKHLGYYGVFILDPNAGPAEYVPSEQKLGIFQVKYHFKDKADLLLIKMSTRELVRDFYKYSFLHTVSMNFPGIGYGGISREDVLPIIEGLSDQVTIYEKE
jgi:hypothetical protein